MNANQTAQFTRLLARALAESIEVIDQGITADGKPFFTVTGSQPNTSYLVIQIDSAHLACTCAAGSGDPIKGVAPVYCKHRAKTTSHLIAQATAAAVAVATSEAQRAADDNAREAEMYPGYSADLDAAAARIQGRNPGSAERFQNAPTMGIYRR